jgi:murein DD-endopeptidase MepM/ murein hydrolase activator NlpD
VKKSPSLAILALVLSAAQAAAAPTYPRFGSLGPDDMIYRQHQEQLAASYSALKGKRKSPEVVVYEYRVSKAVDILSIAARFNLPYETLATLNRLDRSREFLPGEKVLVPTMPGIFAPESPSNDLEILLAYRIPEDGGDTGSSFAAYGPRGRTDFRFFPGERFTPEERALFLGLLFRFPLSAGTLSSGFGLRKSPITGTFAAHRGVDLAAPAGSEVYAAREGRVAEAGIDAVLGNYIALEHEGGWTTVYGHLSTRKVVLNEHVESGMIIGNVGSTGLSTGPHLHFEVRNRGTHPPGESMNRPRPATAAFFAACALVLAGAESRLDADELRTIIAGSVSLSPENPDGSRLTMGISDGVAVVFPKESPFVQGFEIELKSPPSVVALPGGFAYELWRGIEPAPEKGRYGYRGERIITQPLPARAGFVLQIPVRKDHTLKAGPYATLIPTVVAPDQFPFVFKLFPATKGIPPEVESAQIQIRIRPLLTDEGGISVRLRFPEGTKERGEVLVSVDDRRIEPTAVILVKAGAHKLLVKSEEYRDESISVNVEQGKIAEIAIDLQDATPVLVVEAPDSALVLLDGERVDHVANPQLAIEQGEHEVSCKIGDYSLRRSFIAYRGKTYKIVLSIDLQVEEVE